MFDESTDVSTTKASAIINGKIQNSFYRLLQCPDGRTESLFNFIKT